MIKPTCDKCGNELTTFGGLAFSAPETKPDGSAFRCVDKYHLCVTCFESFKSWLDYSTPDDTGKVPLIEEPVDLLLNQPWPLRDVVQKLCEAAEILMHQHNYDGTGYEQILRAIKVGRKWLDDSNRTRRHWKGVADQRADSQAGHEGR